MDSIGTVLARLRDMWAAAKGRSEAEVVRRDLNLPAPSEGRRSSQYPEPVIEPSEQLVEFRLLVGIHQDKSFRAPHGFKPNQRPIVSVAHRSAPNMGIYTTVFDREIKCKKNYKSCSILINSCLGLQIILAAALTALGAADGNHKAITVFGALNTVIAGFLTYLKGTGLPSRLKYYQHEWSKVREYIEQRERDLMCGHHDMDVHEEVERIRQMFENVNADIEANKPDRFVGISQVRQPDMGPRPPPAIVNRSRAPGPNNKLGSEDSSDLEPPTAALSQQQQSPRAPTTDRTQQLGDLEKRLEGLGPDWMHARQTAVNTQLNQAHGFGAQLTGDLQGLKARLEAKMQEIAHLEGEVAAKGRAMLDARRAQPQTAAHDLQATAAREAHGLQQAAAEHEAAAREALAESEHAALGALAQRAEAARAAAAHDLVDGPGDRVSPVGPKDDHMP